MSAISLRGVSKKYPPREPGAERQELQSNTTVRLSVTRLTDTQSGCTDQHCCKNAPLRITCAIHASHEAPADCHSFHKASINNQPIR